MKILGFDSSTLSTAERAMISDLPPGGLFMAITPEYLRELAERQKLADYLTERAADLFEPEQDWLH